MWQTHPAANVAIKPTGKSIFLIMCVIHIGDYADKDSIYFANCKINKDFKVFRDFKVFSVIREGKADKARLDNS